jgi:hypothetical protein
MGRVRQIIFTGHFGSACRNARPYGFVTIRLSRIISFSIERRVKLRHAA